MAQFLAIQIQMGKLTLDRVPERYRADVEAILAANGWGQSPPEEAAPEEPAPEEEVPEEAPVEEPVTEEG